MVIALCLSYPWKKVLQHIQEVVGMTGEGGQLTAGSPYSQRH